MFRIFKKSAPKPIARIPENADVREAEYLPTLREVSAVGGVGLGGSMTETDRSSYARMKEVAQEFAEWRTRPHHLNHVMYDLSSARDRLREKFPDLSTEEAVDFASTWFSSEGLKEHPNKYVASLLAYAVWTKDEMLDDLLPEIRNIAGRMLPPEFAKTGKIPFEDSDRVRQAMTERAEKIEKHLSSLLGFRQKLEDRNWFEKT